MNETKQSLNSEPASCRLINTCWVIRSGLRLSLIQWLLTSVINEIKPQSKPGKTRWRMKRMIGNKLWLKCCFIRIETRSAKNEREWSSQEMKSGKKIDGLNWIGLIGWMIVVEWAISLNQRMVFDSRKKRRHEMQ